MWVGVLFAAELGVSSVDAAAGLELGKGAIIGAMVVGAAFLAGIAVLRRSAAAFCGLLLVAAAGALQAVWLGVIPEPSPTIILLLQGFFAAATLLFLSATIGLANRSQLLGGVLFAGALCLAGVGIINAVLGGEAAGLLRAGLVVVGVAAITLSGIAGARGDLAARLILPGAALVATAPLLFGFAGSAGLTALAPQAVFAIGVLLASLVALGDFGASHASATLPRDGAALPFDGGTTGHHLTARQKAEALRVSENQLAQVLDYSGIAVWDWSRSGNHQSASFASLMGADNDGAFTPEAFRAFVHPDDLARFDEKVCGSSDGDGGFDEKLKLLSGARVRLRGARAVGPDGSLERIVVFLDETASEKKPEALKRAAAPLADASAKEPNPLVSGDAPKVVEASPNSVCEAIERGELVAAFQPIISFLDGAVCGAEALVRWPAGDNKGETKALTTEEIVREAQLAGKGHSLTSIMLKATADHVAEKIAAGEQGYFGAFNVSLFQLREEGFVEDVRRAIAERNLPKGSLVLELTEGEQLVETPRINETFKKLRAAGAALAYDDFGAGFSSLSNLHRYDFDYLKIDKSFIDDIVANGGKKKVAAALARLGRDFEMTVIAEGVETKEAAEIAKAIGCRMGQGYYLGVPTVENVAPLSESGERATAHSAADAPKVAVLDCSVDAAKPASRLFRRRQISVASR